jgi:hypothetical protein
VQSGNIHRKNRSEIESQTKEDQIAPHLSRKGKSVPQYAPEVLTGGHGGSVPALIVRIVRSIFIRDSHSNQK